MLKNFTIIEHLKVVSLRLLLLVGIVTSFLLLGCQGQQSGQVVASDKIVSVDNSLDVANYQETLQWYRDAKFGMFVHWGLYSNGDHEWVRFNDNIPDEQYRLRAASFNPQKFDAELLVKTAKDAGMKFIVITAKHHDGFALFDSAAGDFDIGATPFGRSGRDPLKELAASCKKHGLKLGFYYSQYQDWDHQGGGRADLSYEQLVQRPFQQYVADKALPQLRELLSHYEDIALIWFDTSMHSSEQDAERFKQLVRELSPSTLVGGRIGHGLGDFWSLPDNTLGNLPFGEPWETAKHTGTGWSWADPAENSAEQMSGQDVIHALVKVVSHGGNLLLNTGPSIEGELRAADITAFTQAGQWLQANGESIYQTQKSPWMDESLLATVANNKIYLHVFTRPSDNVVSLNNLNNSITSAYFLTDPQQQALTVQTSGSRVSIDLGTREFDAIDTVVVLEFAGELTVENLSLPRANNHGVIYIAANDINIVDGRFSAYNPNTQTLDVLNTRRSWQNGAYQIDQPGTYRLIIEQSAVGKQGKRYFIRTHDKKFSHAIESSASTDTFQQVELGIVRFTEKGVYNFTLRPEQFFLDTQEPLFSIHSISLVPVNE
jgi:alpha-L-fucosidase